MTIKKVTLFLICIIGFVILAGCMPDPEPDLSDVDDDLEYITRKYGVPEEEVFALADLLGVAHEEITSPQNFDPENPFPISHLKKEFEEFEKEHGRKPLSPEVDQIVKGFKAVCWINAVDTEYLFYSTQVNRTWFWKERIAAVIMVVAYSFEPGRHYERDEAVYKEVWLRDIPLSWDDPWGNPHYSLCIKGTRDRAAWATATTEAFATATAEALIAATAEVTTTVTATATVEAKE